MRANECRWAENRQIRCIRCREFSSARENQLRPICSASWHVPLCRRLRRSTQFRSQGAMFNTHDSVGLTKHLATILVRKKGNSGLCIFCNFEQWHRADQLCPLHCRTIAAEQQNRFFPTGCHVVADTETRTWHGQKERTTRESKERTNLTHFGLHLKTNFPQHSDCGLHLAYGAAVDQRPTGAVLTNRGRSTCVDSENIGNW